MTFSYFSSIPAPGNFPGDDQPLMQTNYASISGLLSVDHVGFNVVNGGQHQQITFNNKNVPGVPTDPVSIIYTNSGLASTVSQLLYRNQNAILPISALRAFGSFNNAAGPAITLLNSFNVVSVTNTSSASTQSYAIVLTANCTTGNNVVVSITLSNVGGFPLALVPYSYSFTGGVLTINVTTIPTATNIINFQVFQF